MMWHSNPEPRQRAFAGATMPAYASTARVNIHKHSTGLGRWRG
jgi:hypothetical protein